MTLDEWCKKVENGTSGDMVFDILRDWAKDREALLQELRGLYEEAAGASL